MIIEKLYFSYNDFSSSVNRTWLFFTFFLEGNNLTMTTGNHALLCMYMYKQNHPEENNKMGIIVYMYNTLRIETGK